MKDNKSAELGLAFVLGGVTGACLALLFAPRTGGETRGLVKDKVREGGEIARRTLDKGRRVVAQAAARVQEAREDVRNLAQEGEQTLRYGSQG